jgi:stearoyl-CoA desaturase (delta-9 desaturase)
MLFGIWKVLFRGAELYRQESENQETMAKFGHGTPNDWLERNVYAKHSALGILIMLGIDLLLFGVVGLTVWAVQMAWIPFWAAGVVNGIGHYWGYRNFASPDTSTNVFPWGIIIGGEELHNNHHAHASSAKFSSQWYEFDIGWVYIRMMQAVGLAKVRKVAPKLKLESDARSVDLKTLHGVITHRYEIMARYADLLKQACSQELSRLKGANSENSAQTSRQTLKRVRNWFHLPDTNLQPEQLAQIDQAVASSESLSTLMQMRKELGRLWESSSASSEQLLHDLQAWCQRAQQSGIEGLAEFASRLRRYAA